MKKSDNLIIVVATLAYSYLFYKQNAGVNFLIFNLLFGGLLAYRDPALLRNREWLMAAGLCLISSMGVLVTSSALSVFANMVSLLLLSAYAFSTKTSAAFSIIFTGYSLVVSLVYMIDKMLRPKPKDASGKKILPKVIMVGFTLLFGIIFLCLYRGANPVFAENTRFIRLDLLDLPSFHLIVFTLVGAVLIHGLVSYQTIAVAQEWENGLPVFNPVDQDAQSVRRETEHTSGILLFGLLNIMLVILNIGDIGSIWLGKQLPEGATLSDFVHAGVGNIVFSIIIALALIMFLFRKNYTATKNHRWLRFLVGAWILQTLLMLFSTCVRNQLYIQSFDLTYLRIGVYVFLLLAAGGLIITYHKIVREKSNWFLVRKNMAFWLGALVFSSLFNWDLIITRYNLQHKPLEQVDLYYLVQLSDANIPELIDVMKDKHFSRAAERYQRERGRAYALSLREKIGRYVENYADAWQSFDLVDSRVAKSIVNRN